jgi:hypothetical protein
MLTKITGNSVIATLSANATGTTTATNFDGSIPRKVRIATHNQPAAVNFGSTTATVTTGILMPADTAEHFSIENTARITYAQVGAGSGGFISITPVA